MCCLAFVAAIKTRVSNTMRFMIEMKMIRGMIPRVFDECISEHFDDRVLKDNPEYHSGKIYIPSFIHQAKTYLMSVSRCSLVEVSSLNFDSVAFYFVRKRKKLILERKTLTSQQHIRMTLCNIDKMSYNRYLKTKSNFLENSIYMHLFLFFCDRNFIT
ncbi:hypothetical protein PUN28_004111 [Cardiocondyla obscurior]|uniref:Uncharacterized protein n=1 Tax=Cardiocondyla obscurior TaxID=286306 RepID=A0AAW2GPM5_9HYME